MNIPTKEQIRALGPVPKDLGGFQQILTTTVQLGDIFAYGSGVDRSHTWACHYVGCPVEQVYATNNQYAIYRRMPVAKHIPDAATQKVINESRWVGIAKGIGLESKPEQAPQNPDALMDPQIGVKDGYRLLCADEVKPRRFCEHIEKWSGHVWLRGKRGCLATGTYRTKLSREELAKWDDLIFPLRDVSSEAKTALGKAPVPHKTPLGWHPIPEEYLSRPAAKTLIPQDDARRKGAPMYRGLIGYFPAALFAVAEHSRESNDKHNPGQEIQWARNKSSDHADCIQRHLIDSGAPGTPQRMYHLRALAWRALALLQEECEAEGAAPGISSKF